MSGSGVDADFNMIQVGIDTVPVVDAPRFGVAFSYAQTESEDNLGTTDMDSFSLAFYGTKMYDNGMFVDVIGRMATMDSDIVNAGAKGKMDNVALSLSGELGWRFDVTDRFFFEPSMEATYTYTNADTFTMTNGGTYELEATDSLVGRAGFAAGFKCPANKGDVYVRAAVVHEFMGDMTVNSSINGVAAASLEADGKDTWFEYAIGAQFNVNKNTYVYADIERTEGATMDEDWRANVGVRFAF
jgi:outer membrane autotransporter protein